tara:strand:- start:140 stop:247 length:108 start_codon:yes stop_codon:yes gene_type:complete
MTIRANSKYAELHQKTLDSSSRVKLIGLNVFHCLG